jgi:hypothetical protein
VVLQPHSFVAVQQTLCLKELKSDFKVGMANMLCDFVENYSFLLDDDAHGFHWNNAHATFHNSFILEDYAQGFLWNNAHATFHIFVIYF